MNYPFEKQQALELLEKKKKTLQRGLSYTEKILFLHQVVDGTNRSPVRGKEQITMVPDRVAMQDATAQMAMLQFMQAGRHQTAVAATIHCDHLLRAGEGVDPDLRHGLAANREVYDFLSSAAARYGIGFWAPGSGIIHQVLLENYAIPGGMMIGTDSHTPNAGGMGMIAIGVGGADAAEAMAGLSWETTMPRLVGVRLRGCLQGWASAKDVIFEMLRRFTVKGGTGKIFEYFGEGARNLSATQKATITNMGAEMGATTSLFVYDQTMDAYLRNVGRPEDADWAASMAEILCQDRICEDQPERVFDEVVDLDLGQVKIAHAGPFSPDRITRVKDFGEVAEREKWPRSVSAVLLGSCTNSSYADLHAAAEILEQAQMHGVKARVPFLLSPGSEQVFETIKKEGILEKLLKAGAKIMAASCGPCIGQWDRRDVQKGRANCLFTTFNRNFRGRNDANPETRAFLTSPGVAAALAVSGDVGFNPETDAIVGSGGETFRLKPPDSPALPPGGLAEVKHGFVPPETGGTTVDVKVDPHSERLQLLEPFEPWNGKDFEDLPILVKTKGKTTTDHISPGGKWLRYRGHLANISRNLLEGAVNAFTGETGHGKNVITGEAGVAFSDLAAWYQEKAGGSVIVGDENYGEGSSREHAAMSPRFLGIRAVLARSFARIHEANLKKQGILPLTFRAREDYGKIGEEDRVSIVGLKDLAPDSPVRALIRKTDGCHDDLLLNHTLTIAQIAWFKAGSALNTLRSDHAS